MGKRVMQKLENKAPSRVQFRDMQTAFDAIKGERYLDYEVLLRSYLAEVLFLIILEMVATIFPRNKDESASQSKIHAEGEERLPAKSYLQSFFNSSQPSRPRSVDEQTRSVDSTAPAGVDNVR